jgi:iron(III) transport system ATP-binding protein
MIPGRIVGRDGDFGVAEVDGGGRLEAWLPQSLAIGDSVRIAIRPENVDVGRDGGRNAFRGRITDRRYQGTQTIYDIELFGSRIEVLELGTAARHAVASEVAVTLPRERCWAYRDDGVPLPE